MSVTCRHLQHPQVDEFSVESVCHVENQRLQKNVSFLSRLNWKNQLTPKNIYSRICDAKISRETRINTIISPVYRGATSWVGNDIMTIMRMLDDKGNHLLDACVLSIAADPRILTLESSVSRAFPPTTVIRVCKTLFYII